MPSGMAASCFSTSARVASIPFSSFREAHDDESKKAWTAGLS